MTHSKERISVWNHGAYVIRDAFDGDRFKGCEYATRDGDEIVWKPCREAALFADIEPLVRVSR